MLRRRKIRAHANCTRTVCFSDMNHIAQTAFYREDVVALAARVAPRRMVEATLQPMVVRNHSRFGTYIYGAPRHPATLARIDASQHGTDELNNNGSYLRGLPPGCSYPCQCPSA